MNTFRLVIFTVGWAAWVLAPLPARAAPEDGVALAIVYDTSGSMKEPVRDANGQMSPKYVIANRALVSIARQLQTFSTNTSKGPRTVHAGLVVFEGNGARQAVKFGPFQASAFEEWGRNFSRPEGGTPLGNALDAAGRIVLGSNLSRKHVLVITDGNNTIGPNPAAVMPRLQQQARAAQTTFSVHFVAFDVNAGVFSGVKKQGATVVGAADEKQLNQQLEFILEKKILLEDEEPPQTK